MSKATLEIVAEAAGRPLPTRRDARERLQQALERVMENLPSSLEFSPSLLGRAIGERLSDDMALDACAAWHWEGLCIAAGVLEGDEEAVSVLGAMVRHISETALRSRGFSEGEVEEVAQQVLVRLSVDGESGDAKIRLYSGQGSLGGYIRSAVVRSGLNLRRGDTRRQTYAFAQRVEEALYEPELRHLKDKYLAQFREALRLAMDDLDTDKRLALRLQLDEGLTIDQLAKLWSVHRATAARRLVAAREALADATRARLKSELDLDDRDVDSVMHFIHSRLGDATSALS